MAWRNSFDQLIVLGWLSIRTVRAAISAGIAVRYQPPYVRKVVAAYVTEHRVPPQSLQDLGYTFIPNSEISRLELKGGVIELVLGVRGPVGSWLNQWFGIRLVFTAESAEPTVRVLQLNMALDALPAR